MGWELSGAAEEDGTTDAAAANRRTERNPVHRHGGARGGRKDSPVDEMTVDGATSTSTEDNRDGAREDRTEGAISQQEAENERVKEQMEPTRSSQRAWVTSRSGGDGEGPSQSCGLARPPILDLAIGRSNVREK